MGQSESVDNVIPNTVETVQEEIVRHARILSEIRALSYDDFVKSLSELNILSRKCLDQDGKQLVFAVKRGTDCTMLWKGTVRIACVKVDPVTKKINRFKFFNLSQFLRVFRTLQSYLQVMAESEQSNDKLKASSQCNELQPFITASVLMDRVELAAEDNVVEGDNVRPGESLHECCICLERKPEVMLPCAHSYCLPCIEQWNVDHKTCPICRETLTSTEDSWVLSQVPEASEISQEICHSLKSLFKEDP